MAEERTIVAYPYYTFVLGGQRIAVVCRKGRWWRIKDLDKKLPDTDVIDVNTPDDGGTNLERIPDNRQGAIAKAVGRPCLQEASASKPFQDLLISLFDGILGALENAVDLLKEIAEDAGDDGAKDIFDTFQKFITMVRSGINLTKANSPAELAAGIIKLIEDIIKFVAAFGNAALKILAALIGKLLSASAEILKGAGDGDKALKEGLKKRDGEKGGVKTPRGGELVPGN